MFTELEELVKFLFGNSFCVAAFIILAPIGVLSHFFPVWKDAKAGLVLKGRSRQQKTQLKENIRKLNSNFLFCIRKLHC